MTRLQIELMSATDLSRKRWSLVKRELGDNENSIRDRQKKFAEVLLANDPKILAGYLSKPKGETLNLPTFSEKITEAQIFNPPEDTENLIYTTLQELEPRHASSPAFWASYHLEMMKINLIEPTYFAMSKVSQSGRARIEEALYKKDADLLSGVVRTFLRRFCGLPEIRGTLSVFNDCRTSRAWWRGFIVSEVRELYPDIEENLLWDVLRGTELWTHLMMYGVRRLTVISDKNIRVALVARLAEIDPTPRDRPRIQRFLKEIGRKSAYQMMGALSIRDNLEIIRSIPLSV